MLGDRMSGLTLGPQNNNTITRSENRIGHKYNLQVLVANEVNVSSVQRLQKGQCEYGQC